MYKHDIGCLPVVNDANEVVGILTSNDVLSAFLDILGYRTSGSRVCIEVKDEPVSYTHLDVYKRQGKRPDQYQQQSGVRDRKQ